MAELTADSVPSSGFRQVQQLAAGQTTPVAAPIQFIDILLTADTSIFASGDVIADRQVVAGCVRAADVCGMLHSIVLIDEDDQKAALTLVFMSDDVLVGTENAPPSISDASARGLLGFVDIATGDYKDLGSAAVVFKNNVGMIVEPAAGTTNIHVGVVNGSGTPTYTANGLRLRLGFLS